MRFYDDGAAAARLTTASSCVAPPAGESAVSGATEKEPAAVPPGRAYGSVRLELASRLSFFLWSSIPDELVGLPASES